MRTIDATPHKPIPLGKTGTANTLTVRFDVTKWLESYPGCSVTLTHKRPTDEEGLPVSGFTVEDGYGKWLVGLADTSFDGDGECELCLIEGDSIIKSITYETNIEKSIAGTGTEPPEPQQGWVDQVVEAAAKAEESITRQPYINDNNSHWMVWDAVNEQYIDTQVNARGQNDSFPYTAIKKIHPYLYEVWFDKIDYKNAYNYYKAGGEGAVGACSSARSGNFFGRNFDWFYNNDVEFIVHTPHIGDRNASVCVARLTGLTKDVVEENKPNEAYSVLPFNVLDGINEYGLVANINVVPTDYGENISYPVEGLQVEINANMLVRYVLDYFDDAQVAAEYIRKHMKVYFSDNLHAHNYEIHIMIADATKTRVVEFVENQAVIITADNIPYMTNFYLYAVRHNEDGKVYTPYTQDATHNAMTTNNITRYGSGLERYNYMVENNSDANTYNGMRTQMDNLFYTKCYPSASDTAVPPWYTEFVGGDLTCGTLYGAYAQILSQAAQEYSTRSRDTATTWQTVHSTVYDIANRIMRIKVQEEDTEYTFSIISNIAIDDSHANANSVWSGYKVNNEINNVKQSINSKIDEPENEGTDGQVLTTDGDGGRSWTTIPESGAQIDDENTSCETVWSSEKTSEELSKKISEPTIEGTSGQVLVTDGEGGRTWETIVTSVQPDWNQNDSTAQDYVKNRIAYTRDPSPVDIFDGFDLKPFLTVGTLGSNEYCASIATTSPTPVPKFLNSLDLLNLEDGDTLDITFNGVQYSLTVWVNNVSSQKYPQWRTGGPDEMICFGNPYIPGYQKSQRPTTGPQYDDVDFLVLYKPEYGYLSTIIYLGDTDILEEHYKFYKEELMVTYKTIDKNLINLPELFDGVGSLLVGENNIGSGYAFGKNNVTSGTNSHAEGNGTTASGLNAHSEGSATTASGSNSHAEGSGTTASGYASHAEGSGTTNYGSESHAEGHNTIVDNSSLYGGHAEGYGTTVTRRTSDYSTWPGSHAEGYNSTASGKCGPHAEGVSTLASGDNGSHAEGYYTIASGAQSHAEGNGSEATGSASHAEGNGSQATNSASHAEGASTKALGNQSHAEGDGSQATNSASHAEGRNTLASGQYGSHAEGNGSKATGYNGSHAEGVSTLASGDNGSHAEGFWTSAKGDYSHAEGYYAISTGECSHAEGYNTNAIGGYSHAEGYSTEASKQYQHVSGKYNILDTTVEHAVIVGNGTDGTSRSNAYTLDWNGKGEFASDVVANAFGSNPISMLTIADYVNVIYKLTKGQAWDIHTDSNAAYEKTIPAGTHLSVLTAFGGRTYVDGQSFHHVKTKKINVKDSLGQTVKTLDIPNEIQSIETYGQSAGSVYNLVKYDDKQEEWSHNQNVKSIDLGSLSWVLYTSGDKQIFYANLLDKVNTNQNINVACTKYTSPSQNAPSASTAFDIMGQQQICGFYNASSQDSWVYIKDNNYSTASNLKTALSGIMLLYETKTPVVTDVTSYMASFDNYLEPIEAGYTIEFTNTDDTQENIISYIDNYRNLSEVIPNG